MVGIKQVTQKNTYMLAQCTQPSQGINLHTSSNFHKQQSRLKTHIT
jgi:hypothetical protein